MDAIERKKAVLAMEFLARQINDEEVFMDWLSVGVADGDIDYGETNPDHVEDYYIEDENFTDIMSTFLRLMNQAYEDGGLYCDGIVSKDKGDYE